MLDNDVNILNYALTLEYLEAAAYKAINDANVLTGNAKTYFADFGAAEQEHVDALISTIKQLGGTPAQMPTFDFSSVPTDADGIVKFFQNVEAVGSSAYLGAAPSISNLDVLAAALSIHTVTNTQPRSPDSSRLGQTCSRRKLSPRRAPRTR